MRCATCNAYLPDGAGITICLVCNAPLKSSVQKDNEPRQTPVSSSSPTPAVKAINPSKHKYVLRDKFGVIFLTLAIVAFLFFMGLVGLLAMNEFYMDTRSMAPWRSATDDPLIFWLLVCGGTIIFCSGALLILRKFRYSLICLACLFLTGFLPGRILAHQASFFKKNKADWAQKATATELLNSLKGISFSGNSDLVREELRRDIRKVEILKLFKLGQLDELQIRILLNTGIASGYKDEFLVHLQDNAKARIATFLKTKPSYADSLALRESVECIINNYKPETALLFLQDARAAAISAGLDQQIIDWIDHWKEILQRRLK